MLLSGFSSGKMHSQVLFPRVVLTSVFSRMGIGNVSRSFIKLLNISGVKGNKRKNEEKGEKEKKQIEMEENLHKVNNIEVDNRGKWEEKIGKFLLEDFPNWAWEGFQVIGYIIYPLLFPTLLSLPIVGTLNTLEFMKSR